MSAAVGADIESLCSKCGDVWHVVVAKVEQRIVRVQCKECGAYHRYKDPTGKAAPKATRASSTPRAPREHKPVQRFEKPEVPLDLSRPARSYRASDRYEVGDRVEHPTFGQGVVEVTTEPGKMTVFFTPGGRKVLVHGKAADGPRLEKPRPFDHTTPSPDRLPPGAVAASPDDDA